MKAKGAVVFSPTRAAVAAALLSVLATGCEGRPRSETSGTAATRHSGPAVAVLDLTAGAPEQESPSLLAMSSRKRSFDELLRSIEAAAKDKDVKGIFVRLGGGSVGAARAEEIGESLAKLRADKKPVFCHGDGYSNVTLMMAARGCSKLYVSPAGDVEAIGIAAQIVYLRKLLADELHLSIDILQVGKFKGAEEPLTRDGPSPEARASLESVLVDMRESWLDGIRTGRGKPDAGDAAEDGPYSPKKAKERGLVDEVGYADEALEAAKAACGAVRDEVRFGRGSVDRPDDLADIVRVLAGEGTSGPIALVRATGSISMTAGRGLFGGSGGITEKELGRILAKLEKDDDVKAVVLRIDSPGGSALASDLLWHQLMKVRAKKPIVVSVGDMAASGGYYLASTANVIFAEPMSIVGSIGVVGGKIGAGDALERIGVHAETFPANVKKPGAAARAAYESPLLAWDDATRARVLESMAGIYELFLARVAEGRKMPVEKVAASAEGRIFSGRVGKERGLVDEIGGLGAAIAKARELAKLPADAHVAVVGQKPGFLQALDPQAESEDSEERAVEAIGAAAPALRPFDELERFAPDLVPFAASMVPLCSGERAAAAIPFAITLR